MVDYIYKWGTKRFPHDYQYHCDGGVCGWDENQRDGLHIPATLGYKHKIYVLDYDGNVMAHFDYNLEEIDEIQENVTKCISTIPKYGEELDQDPVECSGGHWPLDFSLVRNSAGYGESEWTDATNELWHTACYWYGLNSGYNSTHPNDGALTEMDCVKNVPTPSSDKLTGLQQFHYIDEYCIPLGFDIQDTFCGNPYEYQPIDAGSLYTCTCSGYCYLSKNCCFGFIENCEKDVGPESTINIEYVWNNL